MNKQDLVDQASARADVPKAAAGRVIDAVFAAITEAVARGETVTLVGFGSFGQKKRQARSGKNPKTGKPIEIPAKVVPAFKPGAVLKVAVAAGAIRGK